MDIEGFIPNATQSRENKDALKINRRIRTEDCSSELSKEPSVWLSPHSARVDLYLRLNCFLERFMKYSDLVASYGL